MMATFLLLFFLPSTTFLTVPHQVSLAWRISVSPHSLWRPRHLPCYDDTGTFSTSINPLMIFNPQPLVANQSSIACICDIGDLYMLMCILYIVHCEQDSKRVAIA